MTAQAERADTRLVVQVWLGTRLVFALVAVVVALGGRQSLGTVIAQWDVLHFFAIAANGYAQAQDMAFFPGLPAVLRAGAIVGVPMVVTGVTLALVSSLAAALALARLGGTWASVAWLLAPTGVFTAVPYTEAPFCALAFWAWERAIQRRWAQAGLLVAGACTLRVSGLFLVGALAVLMGVQLLATLRANIEATVPYSWSATWPRVLALVLPLAVMAAYACYLYSLTGSWTAWFSAQAAGWQRGFHWPWEAFANSWASLFSTNPGHPEWVWMFRAEMVSWLVGLAITVVLLMRRRVAEASWVGVQVLAFSLSYWFMSVTRAVLLWFPLWGLVGGVVESPLLRSRKLLGWSIAAVAVFVQGLWAWLFFTGRWAS